MSNQGLKMFEEYARISFRIDQEEKKRVKEEKKKGYQEKLWPLKIHFFHT